jgi:hypothetical protein
MLAGVAGGGGCPAANEGVPGNVGDVAWREEGKGAVTAVWAWNCPGHMTCELADFVERGRGRRLAQIFPGRSARAPTH